MTQHLLVIGGQRCGTTYLHAVLDAHPQVTMARPSRPEPKVFLSSGTTARGLDWYLSQYFSHADAELLLGEKSTSYIECAAAADRARTMLGSTQIVVMLRDPVARAVSNWQFSTANGLEGRPLQQALTENLAAAHDWDTGATSVSPFAYLERGRYADYLGPWFDHFPDTMHVRFFEELVGRGDAVGDLYTALDVDGDFRPADVERQVNESEERAPSLQPELTERLDNYFASSNAALRQLLDRSLPWTA